MKRKYMTPETEVFNIKIESALLAGSVLDPTDWTGGGGADAPFMEDDEMNFLMGGGDYSDLEKLLF